MNRPFLFILVGFLGIWGVITLPLSLSQEKVGSIPAKPAANPADIVQQLGHESYEVREAAFQALLGLGQKAEPALRTGLKHADAEVRRSCLALLPLCQRSNLDIRLETFLSEGEDKQTPALVGWGRFRQLAGNDLSSRRMFVDLYRYDRAVLELLERDAAQVGTELKLRSQKMNQHPFIGQGAKKPVGSAELAGLLLAAACNGPGLDLSEFYRFSNIFYQPAVRSTLFGDPAASRLLTPVLSGKLNDQGAYHQVVYLATSLGLTEFLEKTLKPQARKMAAAAGAKPDDLNQLSQSVQICLQVGLDEAIEKDLKPAVRKIAAASVGSTQVQSQLYQVIYLARSLNMKETIEGTLKPAMVKLLAEATTPPLDVNKINQAWSAAQSFPMNEEIDMFLKPAAHRLALEVTRQPYDQNRFYQVVYLVRNLRLQQTQETVLKPYARREIFNILEQTDDVSRLSQAANLAQNLNMGDTLEETLKPAVAKILAESMSKGADANQVSQAYHLAQTLGLRDAIENVIKPGFRRALLAAKDQPLSQGSMYQVLSLAQALQLKEALPLALKAALAKEVPTYARGQALIYLAKMGDKELIPKLEPLLSDTGNIGSMGINSTTITTQLRDVTLAAMITLSGRALKDYEFPYYQMIPGADFCSSGSHSAGFADEATRKAALKKWKDFQAGKK